MEDDERKQSGRTKRNPQVRIFENTEELSTNLVDYVAQLSEAAVKERGAFALVLSGGNQIQLLGKLTRAPYVKTVDWSKWHVFWAEENVVAKKHPNSNYKQAKDGLLSKVPINPSHVFSINPGVSAERAAEEYEFGLRQLVRKRTVGVSRLRDCPKFDLILLGLGSDGHIASLFPNHPLLEEKCQWVAFLTNTGAGAAETESITMTLPVINSAANVAMIATGSSTARSLAAALGDLQPAGDHPAQFISPEDGNLVWFVDANAASLIPHPHHT